MQKAMLAITPQKKTLKHHCFDQHLKELSPLLPTVLSSNQASTSKLQMMQSPAPINKDLFYQLLASQIKSLPKNYDEDQIFEENEDSSDFINHGQILSQQSDQYGENDYEIDENGVKKRKRKSTNQIKMLKVQLETQPNWNKQKIAEMSQITGLSQSQVYKWWWDQKKKNMKNQNQSLRMANKRKIIKKQYSHYNRAHYNKVSSDEQNEQNGVQTKAKLTIEIEEIPQTQKKVNKRLIF